ncbi:hypothetical protein K6Q96_03080 [Grimontia kaedaensis]|uniref:Type 4 fimbrial biogenesis protein PilX N-terminal domain-containing protein n=1 Tax=Grimontia kaedaensis TaxID=2872157 RepID=A0ABY4WTV9_9GAMM|nr:hypothetical protein [Grimontia kaedaensis]USH03023.1 hypothetical protein K6Q96_03080 [Grimontia kaedaensis]
MNTQKGMATLAVVSGVLLVVAMFAISVANSGLADIKKTQNLVLDAKQRASAKAGLDCAIAVFEQSELNPKDVDFSESVFDECENSTGSSVAIIGSESPWLLTARSGYVSSNVVIQSGGVSAAAFKTTGSLIVDGGNAWTPAKGSKVATADGIDIYECTAIIAGGDVTIDVGNSAAEFTSELTGENEQCHSNFSSHIPANTEPVTNSFESDILTNQENIDVFQDFFDVPKEKWEEVKSGYDVTLTTGSAVLDETKTAVSDCGASIKSLIAAGNKKIWVEGDCMLSGLSGAGSKDNPPTVVIKNGVVGANSAFVFNGTIFQFTIDYAESAIANSWGAYKKTDGTGHILCNNGAMSALCAQVIAEYQDDTEKWGKLPFFFNGSYESFGSYLLDVDNSISLVRGAFKPGHDEGSEPAGTSTVPMLVKGSIHDF